MSTYLRMMLLPFRYTLGFETLWVEVSDSIAWRRFCRISLAALVPHPTTLMKITSRCGSRAIDALNEALLARAAEEKLVRLDRARADSTVVDGVLTGLNRSKQHGRFVTTIEAFEGLRRTLPRVIGAAGWADSDGGHQRVRQTGATPASHAHIERPSPSLTLSYKH